MPHVTKRPSPLGDNDPFVRLLQKILQMTGLCWGPKNERGRRTVIAVPAPHNGHSANAGRKPVRTRKRARVGHFNGFTADQRRINAFLEELRNEYPSGMARRSSVVALLADRHPEKSDPVRGVRVRHAVETVVTVLIRHYDLSIVNRDSATREEVDDPLLSF